MLAAKTRSVEKIVFDLKDELFLTKILVASKIIKTPIISKGMNIASVPPNNSIKSAKNAAIAEANFGIRLLKMS
jgi:hypothetical protein